MMPRKKRKVLLITSIIVVVIIIAISIILLYLTTDMFKSNSTLFAKYMGQNVENISSVFYQNVNNQFEETLKQSKHTVETQVTANLTKDTGTTSENTDNSINKLKLKINGQVDNANSYNYQNIKLLNGDEKVAQVLYLQNDEIYGMKFKNLFNQYILINKEEIKDTAKQVGIPGADSIPDNIDIKAKINEIFNLTDEEKQILSTKYANIINSNVSKDKFSKQSNQTIQIDEKNIVANAYTLTLTKEQLNGIYIKFLEQLKEEEIIISRLNKIQELMSSNENTTDLKSRYSTYIDSIIDNINNNNIGQEETKIIVYESNRTTVKTTIQGSNYETSIEILEGKYINYILKNTENEEQTISIKYKNEGEKSQVSIENTTGEKTKKYIFELGEKIEGETCNKTVLASYVDDSNKFEFNIEQKIEIVDEFQKTVKLTDKNSINLSKLEDEQKQNVMNNVVAGLAEKLTDLTTNVIKTEDISDILKVLGFIQEPIVIEGGQVTETQRNRYNSKFEMLQANDLEKENAKELIDSLKDSLNGFEVVSNKEIRLKIEQAKSDSKAIEQLKKFIEENGGIKYNAKVEYDETTGLVNGMLLTLKKE